MSRTQEERNNSLAALANSIEKQPSMRPESLLEAYRTYYSDARVIIDEFWYPPAGWVSGTKRVSLVRFVEAIDV